MTAHQLLAITFCLLGALWVGLTVRAVMRRQALGMAPDATRGRWAVYAASGALSSAGLVLLGVSELQQSSQVGFVGSVVIFAGVGLTYATRLDARR